MKIKGNISKPPPVPKLENLKDGDVFQIAKKPEEFYIRGGWSQRLCVYEVTSLHDGSHHGFIPTLEVVPCPKAILAFEE